LLNNFPAEDLILVTRTPAKLRETAPEGAQIRFGDFIAADPDYPSLAVRDHRGTEELLKESGMIWSALLNSQHADFIFAAGPNAIRLGKWITSAAEGSVEASNIPRCSDDLVSFERTIREGRFSIISDDVETLTGQKPMSMRRWC
jgi:uncharacterized protein YbjT (DUF2867 family)